MTDSGVRWRAFWGLFLRDFTVLRRQFVAFLIRTIMNPLLFVFVFTYLFPKIGQGFQSSAGASFGTLILPGLLAIGIFIQGIMATALPLSVEIGSTREIHDRVMSPLPVSWVAVQKIIFSAVQSLLAALVGHWPEISTARMRSRQISGAATSRNSRPSMSDKSQA